MVGGSRIDHARESNRSGHNALYSPRPGLGDRVDKSQRGLQVTGFGEGDSRGFVSRTKADAAAAPEHFDGKATE
jgi:hypothetical protein